MPRVLVEHRDGLAPHRGLRGIDLAQIQHVTLHDARVSITAGFLGDELPEALGMADGSWDTSCTLTTLGALRMVAVRRT